MSTNPLFEYPDNLIVVLQRHHRSIKVTTTGEPDRFKVVSGLDESDGIIDGCHITERELKQLVIDSCINGYELRLNQAFKKSLYALALELAEERKAQLRAREEGDTDNQDSQAGACSGAPL